MQVNRAGSRVDNQTRRGGERAAGRPRNRGHGIGRRGAERSAPRVSKGGIRRSRDSNRGRAAARARAAAYISDGVVAGLALAQVQHARGGVKAQPRTRSRKAAAANRYRGAGRARALAEAARRVAEGGRSNGVDRNRHGRRRSRASARVGDDHAVGAAGRGHERGIGSPADGLAVVQKLVGAARPPAIGGEGDGAALAKSRWPAGGQAGHRHGADVNLRRGRSTWAAARSGHGVGHGISTRLALGQVNSSGTGIEHQARRRGERAGRGAAGQRRRGGGAAHAVRGGAVAERGHGRSRDGHGGRACAWAGATHAIRYGVSARRAGCQVDGAGAGIAAQAHGSRRESAARSARNDRRGWSAVVLAESRCAVGEGSRSLRIHHYAGGVGGSRAAAGVGNNGRVVAAGRGRVGAAGRAADGLAVVQELIGGASSPAAGGEHDAAALAERGGPAGRERGHGLRREHHGGSGRNGRAAISSRHGVSHGVSAGLALDQVDGPGAGVQTQARRTDRVGAGCGPGGGRGREGARCAGAAAAAHVAKVRRGRGRNGDVGRGGAGAAASAGVDYAVCAGLALRQVNRARVGVQTQARGGREGAARGRDRGRGVGGAALAVAGGWVAERGYGGLSHRDGDGIGRGRAGSRVVDHHGVGAARRGRIGWGGGAGNLVAVLQKLIGVIGCAVAIYVGREQHRAALAKSRGHVRVQVHHVLRLHLNLNGSGNC